MTNRNMYMAQACAGVVEKCGDKRKDRIRWIRWLISELILLSLLIAAGMAGLKYRMQYKGNYAVSSIPKTVMEQSVPAEAPAPRNMLEGTEEFRPEQFLSAETEEPYYAGPVGDMVKTPGEITVVLDPGHGGIDEGCARGGVREKEVNLAISLNVQTKLRKLGYQVVMTRDTDESLSLGERIQTAEEAKGDIYVSIHQNSSNLYRVNGLEIYYSTENAKADSKRLSELIHQDVLTRTGAKARSIFEWENIRVIREAQMPACLIETGFLTNAAERRKLADPAYQEQLAEGIAAGIDRYFRPSVLYLTFDGEVTEKDAGTMLSALKEQNIKAVFFVTEETVRKTPGILNQITEAGHSIGLYANRQAYQTVYADVDRYLTALENTYRTIQRTTGEPPVLFSDQTTGSSISADTIQKLKACGFTTYNWTPML